MYGYFFAAYDEIGDRVIAFGTDNVTARCWVYAISSSGITQLSNVYIDGMDQYWQVVSKIQQALDPYGIDMVLQHATENNVFRCVILDGGVWDAQHISDALGKIASLASFEI
jgi:hypothetical protein